MKIQRKGNSAMFSHAVFNFPTKQDYIKIYYFSEDLLLDKRHFNLHFCMSNKCSLQKKLYLKFNTRKTILCDPLLFLWRKKIYLFYFLFSSDISEESICFSQFIFVASLILCSITWLSSIDIFFGVSRHISRTKLRSTLGTKCKCLQLCI